MTAPRKIPGNQTTLAITPSGGSLTLIGGIKKIKPPGAKREEIDVTDLSETTVQKILSIIESGEAEFSIFWDSTNAAHAALWTNFNAAPLTGIAAVWTITLNDMLLTTATTISFAGQLSSWPWDEINNKEAVSVDLTVTISGPITITPAT